MTDDAERLVNSSIDDIEKAAFILIGLVRGAERKEKARSTGAELSLTINLIGGGTEEWTITIERTASSH